MLFNYMGASYSYYHKECYKCGNKGKSYYNPLIRFYHIGKYDKVILCYKCLRDRIIDDNGYEIINGEKYTNVEDYDDYGVLNYWPFV